MRETSEVDASHLYVITGIMAAGKSSVAQELAERFDRSVHLRGDGFRRAIVSGRQDMTAQPTDEAFEQLRLRYRLATAAAETYVEAGFTTILQDVVIGPMLGEFIATIRHRPLHVVVLAPSREEVARREAGRSKQGYGSITPDALDEVLRSATPQLGLWLDSTQMTIEETVDNILRSDHLSAIP